ncbi:RidA family protein [Pelagibacteraceae bacterium]|nr:RidA family protein [Pelagibacteraceae bacterium]
MTKIFFGDPHKSGNSSIPLSKAVRAGDFVYVSGQTANDGKGGIITGNIEDQTNLIMNNIIKILDETKCGLEDIIKTTVWLSDARDFGRFNNCYAKFFENNKPARSTTVCDLVVDAKIEIEVIAYKPLKE